MKKRYEIRMITFTVLQSINCQNFVNTINIYMLTQPKGVKKFTVYEKMMNVCSVIIISH